MDSLHKFKPGDLVKILSNEDWGECPVGSVCEIHSQAQTENYLVYTPDKSDTWAYKQEHLELVSATAPSEITIGGVRYTLTPVQEAEAAPEREPKRGEIWRNQADNYVLISEDSDNENDPRITELTGDDVGRSYFEWHSTLTFAFPDLRAAIAAGVL